MNQSRTIASLYDVLSGSVHRGLTLVHILTISGTNTLQYTKNKQS